METATLTYYNDSENKEEKKIEKKNKILVLLDWENLERNTELPPKEKFSLKGGFDRLIRQISEIGEVILIVAFIPTHMASWFSPDLYKIGAEIITVDCPRVKKKGEQEKDTVDEIMTNFGKFLIDHLPELTHICIGSGDRDFALLARVALKKGLKIMVVAGNLRSLSLELASLADEDASHRKMIYLFSPQK